MKHEHTRKTDPEWVRSAVESHAADLTRYAASILGGDIDTARDVVQDVFVRLWQQPREEVENHLLPWLFRVCRNRAIDARRKGGRMKPLDETTITQSASESPGPQDQAESRDRHDQVLDLMKDLPENQREVVRLKFQNGLSYREIASVTELSVTNVGYLLHTALSSLRKQVRAIGE